MSTVWWRPSQGWIFTNIYWMNNGRVKTKSLIFTSNVNVFLFPFIIPGLGLNCHKNELSEWVMIKTVNKYFSFAFVLTSAVSKSVPIFKRWTDLISKHYLPLLEKVTNVRGNCSVSSCCSGFRMCITVVGIHSDVEF